MKSLLSDCPGWRGDDTDTLTTTSARSTLWSHFTLAKSVGGRGGGVYHASTCARDQCMELDRDSGFWNFLWKKSKFPEEPVMSRCCLPQPPPRQMRMSLEKRTNLHGNVHNYTHEPTFGRTLAPFIWMGWPCMHERTVFDHWHAHPPGLSLRRVSIVKSVLVQVFLRTLNENCCSNTFWHLLWPYHAKHAVSDISLSRVSAHELWNHSSILTKKLMWPHNQQTSAVYSLRGFLSN